MNDAHLFKVAREWSKKADYTGNARVGCVITYKGCILAKGFNSDKTHTIQDKYNILRFKNCDNHYLPSKVHAELSALQKIKYYRIDFSRVQIYVYRELHDGTMAMARPCEACFAAIKALGIKTIKYTTEHGYAIEKII